MEEGREGVKDNEKVALRSRLVSAEQEGDTYILM